MKLIDIVEAKTPEAKEWLKRSEQRHKEEMAAREAAEDKYWSEFSDVIEKYPICGPRRP